MCFEKTQKSAVTVYVFRTIRRYIALWCRVVTETHFFCKNAILPFFKNGQKSIRMQKWLRGSLDRKTGFEKVYRIMTCIFGQNSKNRVFEGISTVKMSYPLLKNEGKRNSDEFRLDEFVEFTRIRVEGLRQESQISRNPCVARVSKKVVQRTTWLRCMSLVTCIFEKSTILKSSILKKGSQIFGTKIWGRKFFFTQPQKFFCQKKFLSHFNLHGIILVFRSKTFVWKKLCNNFFPGIFLRLPGKIFFAKFAKKFFHNFFFWEGLSIVFFGKIFFQKWKKIFFLETKKNFFFGQQKKIFWQPKFFRMTSYIKPSKVLLWFI